MSKYLASRLLQTIPTVILVTVAVFLMLHLTPGDPAEVFLGDKRSSPELLEKVREDMGLNRPLHIQYLSYMGAALRGDLGRSLQTNVPVMEQILNRLPWTIELAAAALLIAASVGISIGIIAALNHNTIIDTLAMALALVGISMPVYWSSLLLILLFAVQLRVLPAIGQGGIERLILPATALALVSAGSLARMVRSSMLEVLNQDFVLTARSKGISERLVVIRHVLAQRLNPGGDHTGNDARQFAQRRRHHRDHLRPTRHRPEIRRGGVAKGLHHGAGHDAFHRLDVRAGQHRC